MAVILSLKAARKKKARADKEQAAAENRALHGLSKSEKLRLNSEKSAATAKLDGHKKQP